MTKRIAFFGDSFVRLFSLVKNPAIEIVAFKGGSAKGIGRETNENRGAIVRRVTELRPERIVLCFGSVDVHLSYYYARVNGTRVDYERIANAYIDFVHTDLGGIVTPENICIVGVYPSPLEDVHVTGAVMNYGSITKDQIHLLDESADISNTARQHRVTVFNSYLQRACAKYGFTFDNVCDDMIDASTNQLKDSYRDVSSHNIHIVWETTVLLWMKKWDWYAQLAPHGFEEGLQHTLDQYLQTKPWAEKTHVASTMGVRTAFDRDNIE
jgi:hypothetical protein